MDAEEICYHEKSKLEAQMTVKKPHKESFYVDKKDGFTYQICIDCNSLFCNPRPNSNILNKYITSIKYEHLQLHLITTSYQKLMFYLKIDTFYLLKD